MGYVSWFGLDSNSLTVRGTLFNDTLAQQSKLPRFETGDVVKVSGMVGDGKYGYSIYTKGMEKITDQAEIDEFKNICFPSVPKEQLDKYIGTIITYSLDIQDENLKYLSECLMEYLKPYLPKAPAAKANHEPFRGGLAKHIFDVVCGTDNLLFRKDNGLRSSPYGLNWDVSNFSALYHDIGKVKEYTEELQYNPESHLISHSAFAMKLIATAIHKFDVKVDPKLLYQVEHCIMAHHGEFSEVKPATREAVALHYIDNIMAKLGHFDECVRKNEIGSNGYGRHSLVLNTSPYVPELDEGRKSV
jgi:23S rRNA maturation-related 3'-5' exoribonuclease YhaM